MKKFFKRGIYIICGCLLLACSLGVLLCGEPQSEQQHLLQQINQLPDYDYIAEIKSLMRDHRWGEAQTLCEDVIATGLPAAAQAKELLAQCQQKSAKLQTRIYKTAKAFITGNPDNSIEELGGAIVADMLLYGDLRDLAMQGYFKITGRETDPVIAALAAAGVITEFADMADWAPAALKAFRKLGAINDSLAKHLLKILQDVVKNRQLTASCSAFFQHTRLMLDKAGFVRCGNIFRQIKTPSELAITARHTAVSPHATHLISRHAQKQTVQTLQMLDDLPKNLQLKKQLLKKGARSLKYISRLSKIALKKQYHGLLADLFRQYKYIISGILFTAGALLLAVALYRCRTKKQDSNV